MRSLHSHTIVLQPEDNGTFVAYVPAMEGCHAWGETPEAAQRELLNVFDMIRDEYIHAAFSSNGESTKYVHKSRTTV